MTEQPEANVYTKKAFELSYALIRAAIGLNEQRISDQLFDFSFRLIGLFARRDYRQVKVFIEEIGWFVRLCSDTEIIPSRFGESLLVELAKLQELAKEAEKQFSIPESADNLLSQLPDSPFPLVNKKNFSTKKDNLAKSAKEEKIDNLPDSTQSFHYDSHNRQSAIIDFFKDKSISGNDNVICRIKDIQDKFPNVSERTLRYDLQKLIEQGLIGRVGAGPISAYRLLPTAQDKNVTTVSGDRYSI